MAIVFTSESVAKNTTTKNLDLIKAAECKLQEKSVEYTQNAEFEVLPDEGYDGMSKVNVSVDVVVPTVQATKEITITQNGPIEILPDSDYDVMEKVEATINVPTGGSIDVAANKIKLQGSEFTEVPEGFDFTNVTNGEGILQSCPQLTSFTKELPNLQNGAAMFNGDSALTTFNIDMPELTSGENIKFYTASTLMYCPLNADLSVYRVITEEQHKEYLELKEMSLKPKHIE